jgi:hypothetical protein
MVANHTQEETDMTEFQQIESVVQRVVGRPLAALVYGVFVAGRWVYQGVCNIIARLRQPLPASASGHSKK